MKKLILAFVALIVLSNLTVSAEDITKPIMEKEEVFSLIDSAYNAPASTFLLKKLDRPDHRGIRVVYVHEGRRYTLDHNWWIDGIQIWVRDDGTSDPRLANALSDTEVDGEVDSGTDGHIRIFAKKDHYHEGSSAEGLEYQSYWQDVYNQALASLRAVLRQD